MSNKIEIKKIICRVHWMTREDSITHMKSVFLLMVILCIFLTFIVAQFFDRSTALAAVLTYVRAQFLVQC